MAAAFRDVRGEVAVPPGLGLLVRALRDHPAELECDLRARYGIGLRDLVTGATTVREAVAYVDGFLVDWSSRTWAVLAGWDRPMSEQSILAARLIPGYAAWPWGQVRALATRPASTPEQVEAALAVMRARGPQPATTEGGDGGD